MQIPPCSLFIELNVHKKTRKSRKLATSLATSTQGCFNNTPWPNPTLCPTTPPVEGEELNGNPWWGGGGRPPSQGHQFSNKFFFGALGVEGILCRVSLWVGVPLTPLPHSPAKGGVKVNGRDHAQTVRWAQKTKSCLHPPSLH